MSHNGTPYFYLSEPRQDNKTRDIKTIQDSKTDPGLSKATGRTVSSQRSKKDTGTPLKSWGEPRLPKEGLAVVDDKLDQLTLLHETEGEVRVFGGVFGPQEGRPEDDGHALHVHPVVSAVFEDSVGR